MEVLQRTANRGSISTGYDIDNSLKLEADDSQYIDDRHYTAGNRKKLTISFWFKRTELGQTQMPYEQSALQARIYLRSTDDLYITAYDAGGWTIITNRLFRDPSAWYHCVFQLDTTQSTAADRMKLWINGQQETSFSSASYPTQNADTFFNTNQSAKVGGGGAGLYFSGYMSEFFFIDDQALQASDFGEYDSDSGIWIPKEYDGTFGGQSYYLEFKNASNLADRSDGLSNGVSLSVQNITSADQATDTPTNNFATWQALTGQPYPVIRNGATHYNLSGQVGWYSNVGSIAFTKGKWYAEFRLGSGITNMMAGVSQVESEQSWNNTHLGGVANSTAYTMGFYNANGNVYTDNGSTAWDSSFPAGTIIMVAVDYKTSGVVSLYFGTNGTWANSSNPETGANNFDMNSGSPLPNNLAISFAASPYNNGGNAEANFGGFSGFSIASGNSDANGYGTFEYAPPSGYYALCTKNLAEYG